MFYFVSDTYVILLFIATITGTFHSFSSGKKLYQSFTKTKKKPPTSTNFKVHHHNEIKFSSPDLKEIKPKEVDLSENLFTNVTVMAELPIEILNLSRCRIDMIEFGSFKDLQSMRVLDLSYNKLTTDKLSPHAFEVNLEYKCTCHNFSSRHFMV